MTTTAQAAIDEAKLEQFVGSVVGDLGATLNTALIRIGDELGLYKAMAGAGPLTAAELAERTGDRGALRARVARRPGRRRLRRLRRRQRDATSCRPSRRWRSPTRTARRSCSAAFRWPARCSPTSRSSPRPFTDRRGGRLARARPPALRGHRALLPPGLSRQPGRCVDPGARRGRGEARGRRQGRRRRLRPRRLDDHHGRGLSRQSTFVGFDYHDGSIEAARRSAERGRGRRTGSASRSPARRTTQGDGL